MSPRHSPSARRATAKASTPGPADGEIPGFTGISDPYEAPEEAELRIETSGRTVDECARQILDYVLDR